MVARIVEGSHDPRAVQYARVILTQPIGVVNPVASERAGRLVGFVRVCVDFDYHAQDLMLEEDYVRLHGPFVED